MTKRDLIEEIVLLNPTAGPAFLSRFSEKDLQEYLQHLQWVAQPGSAALTRPAAAPAESSSKHYSVNTYASSSDKATPAADGAYHREASEQPSEAVSVAVAEPAQTVQPLPFASARSEEDDQTYLF